MDDSKRRYRDCHKSNELIGKIAQKLGEVMEKVNPWEDVSANEVTHVCRHKVEGGWLYSTTVSGVNMFTVTFVPEIDLSRYQAHLRDAWKQGHDQGVEDARRGLNANLELTKHD